MSKAQEIVENLEVKINKLIKAHESKVQEVVELTEENQKLKNVVNQQNDEITQLNEKVRMIKLAKKIEASGKDAAKLKLKINEVVREVDKCIAMLNK